MTQADELISDEVELVSDELELTSDELEQVSGGEVMRFAR
jgi:bacteriocin-like protein